MTPENANTNPPGGAATPGEEALEEVITTGETSGPLPQGFVETVDLIKPGTPITIPLGAADRSKEKFLAQAQELGRTQTDNTSS